MGPSRALIARLKSELKSELRSELKPELKSELAAELKPELKAELRAELKAELRAELKPELKAELRSELLQLITLAHHLPQKVATFCADIHAQKAEGTFAAASGVRGLRRLVRTTAGLSAEVSSNPDADELLTEFRLIHAAADTLRPAFLTLSAKRVLFCGQAYYNTWHLSRALRPLGWKADVYNWDGNQSNDIYYHGQDFRLGEDVAATLEGELGFYLSSLYQYDIVHFSNAHAIAYGWRASAGVANEFGDNAEIFLLKTLGKKLVYSNNGCLDGVSQTAFSKWGPESVCSICRWQNEPAVCSDERNLAWGKFRNEVADFQCTVGGNRADYNDDPRVHEEPEFYCLDAELLNPDIEIPDQYKLPALPPGGIRLYHAVGHRLERTRSDGVNIKSTHVYLPLIDRLRKEGMQLELIEPTGIPNKEVRFLQAQADIFIDMLTFGWFGANIREAMMLEKPVICFIRPEWLESVHEELPEYAEELPIISATPHTVEAVLRDLIAHPEKRREIGLRSRKFAMKWHSAEAGGKRFDEIYTGLLAGKQLLRKQR